MSIGINLHRDAPGDGVTERAAFRDALRRWGWDGTEGSPYQIATESEVGVDVYADGLDTDDVFDHANLEPSGIDSGVCRLVLDLARAGRFTIGSDADPQSVILTDEEQRSLVSTDWPRVLVCDTPDALYAALNDPADE